MYQRDHSSRVLFRDIYIYALGGCVDSPRVSHDDRAIFEQNVVRSLSGIQALQSMLYQVCVFKIERLGSHPARWYEVEAFRKNQVNLVIS